MAIKNIDFSSVKDSAFEALPDGIYNATVAKVEDKTSSAGNPYLKVEFTLHGEDCENRKVWGNYVLSENALWRLKRLLSALGMNPDELAEFDTDDMVGLECQLQLVQDEYEGKVNNKIDKEL